MSSVLSPQFNGANSAVKLNRAGFSLVELSIVLVILGLLTGGILTGQNLIRAAEMRSVTTQMEQYRAAIYTFRDKYFALPGDMRNATDFWGSKGGTGNDSACYSVVATGKATCNGNGNGHVFKPITTPDNRWERWLFWQHLANAGLIEGTYSAVADSGGVNDGTAGYNTPVSKISNGGFMVVDFASSTTGNPEWQEGTEGLMLTIGADGELGAMYPLFKPEEAWNIDKKFDDGRPGIGAVKAFKLSINPNCTTSDTTSTSEYLLTDSGINCAINFKID